MRQHINVGRVSEQASECSPQPGAAAVRGQNLLVRLPMGSDNGLSRAP